MKKLLQIIAVLMIIPTVMTAQTAKPRQWKGAPSKLSTTTTMGDVNGDGDINVTDVTLLVGHILGNENSNFIIENADVNGDGDITVTDVTKLVSNILEGNGGGGTGDTSQAYLTCPDDNHPHMIDLGLPSGTKWACCNVGADNPEAYGGYYAWGETEEKDSYSIINYIHFDKTQYLGSDISRTQYDVAHVRWGGSWVMPSNTQQQELLDNCTCKYTTINGVNGALFTGPNGGTIFLPAAGGRWIDDLCFSGDRGYYYSSSQQLVDPVETYYLFFEPGVWDFTGVCEGFNDCGFTVRPVWVP